MNCSRILRIGLLGLGLCLVLTESSDAFYYPLQQTQIRQAYLLGRSADTKKISELLDTYSRHFPFAPSDARVESIEFRTPYEQIVRRSWEHQGGYDLDQAEKDYASQPELVIISVIIYSPLTNPESTANHSDKPSPVGSPDDAWLGFRFLVSQEHPIAPKKMVGKALYGGRYDKGVRKEVLMEFDADQFESGTARVQVTMSGGQKVDAEFELDSLK
jgi:hypothetical protein